MHVDFLSMYADEQQLSGQSDSEKTLDISKAGVSEGVGYIYVRCVGACSGLTGVTLQGSDDGSTFTDVMTVMITDTTDGGGVNFAIPQGLPQYTKLVFNGSPSGKVSAGITLRPDSPRGARIGDYDANPNYAV